eukprot:jgi/Mesvir1/29080/Mv18386-RA.1
MCLLVFFLLLGIAVEGSSAVCHSGSENLKPCSVQLEESTGRTIVSNGLPGHSIMQAGGNFPSVCEVYRRVKLPASPIQSPTATPAKDFAIVGFALNGVVIRNVQTPAVLIKLPTQQGTPCNGGVDPSGGWFYETVPVSVNADGTCAGSTRENDLVGYALDGFPIYGPLGTDARRSGPQLDECNGRLVDGNYRYHLMGGFPCFRAVPQVVETLPAEEGADCLALANAAQSGDEHEQCVTSRDSFLSPPRAIPSPTLHLPIPTTPCAIPTAKAAAAFPTATSSQGVSSPPHHSPPPPIRALTPRSGAQLDFSCRFS